MRFGDRLADRQRSVTERGNSGERMTSDECRRPKHRDRQVFRVGQLCEADIAVIAATQAPKEAAAFDHEIEVGGP